MAAAIKYNNSTVTSVENGGTVILETSKKWMEGDIEVQDTTIINALNVTPTAAQQVFDVTNDYELIGSINVNDDDYTWVYDSELERSVRSHTFSVDLSDFSAGDICQVTGTIYIESNGAPTYDIQDLNGTFTWGASNSYTKGVYKLIISASSVILRYTGDQTDVISSSGTNPDGFHRIGFRKISGVSGYNPVTVSGDANLIASNIKSGVSIFGVTGNYSSTVLIQDSLDANGGTIRTITSTEDPIYLDALSVTTNGTYTPSANHYYSSVNVHVIGDGSVSLQAKTDITPTESSQTITPDSDYDGLSSVQINAISSTYVGSEIAQRSSSNLTVSGATVIVPAGYYSTQASKSIASGTASAPISITGTSASVSTGTNTLTLTKVVSVTPAVSAGYISSGTATNSSVSLTASITTKAAATITPTTSNQTIAAGTYLTGIQTIAGDANLIASNIKSGVSIFGITGSYSGSSSTPTLQEKTNITPTTSSQTITADSGYDGLSSVQINAMPSGSATVPTSISDTAATVSTGTNTLTLTKTISVTPIVSAGYVSAGTAGNSSVSLTASVTTKAATTYNTSSSDQTIAASQYLTGAQTIRAVTTSGISAANIKAGVTVNVGDSADADRIIGVTGTFTSDADATATDIVSSKTAYVNGSKITGSLVVNKYYTGSSAPAASLGSNGDIYLQE